MAKRVPTVRKVSHFARLAKTNDHELIGMATSLVRYSPTPVFPKTFRYNTCRVSRQAGAVTVHFFWSDASNPAVHEETGRYCFVPSPDFD